MNYSAICSSIYDLKYEGVNQCSVCQRSSSTERIFIVVSDKKNELSKWLCSYHVVRLLQTHINKYCVGMYLGDADTLREHGLPTPANRVVEMNSV